MGSHIRRTISVQKHRLNISHLTLNFRNPESHRTSAKPLLSKLRRCRLLLSCLQTVLSKGTAAHPFWSCIQSRSHGCLEAQYTSFVADCKPYEASCRPDVRPEAAHVRRAIAQHDDAWKLADRLRDGVVNPDQPLEFVKLYEVSHRSMSVFFHSFVWFVPSFEMLIRRSGHTSSVLR